MKFSARPAETVEIMGESVAEWGKAQILIDGKLKAMQIEKQGKKTVRRVAGSRSTGRRDFDLNGEQS